MVELRGVGLVESCNSYIDTILIRDVFVPLLQYRGNIQNIHRSDKCNFKQIYTNKLQYNAESIFIAAKMEI